MYIVYTNNGDWCVCVRVRTCSHCSPLLLFLFLVLLLPLSLIIIVIKYYSTVVLCFGYIIIAVKSCLLLIRSWHFEKRVAYLQPRTVAWTSWSLKDKQTDGIGANGLRQYIHIQALKFTWFRFRSQRHNFANWLRHQ